MKWYLHPQGVEFSDWRPRAIGKHLPNVSIPTNEPASVLMIGENKLLPLTDTPPTLDADHMVDKRTIKALTNTAKAVYTTVEKSAEIKEAERKASVPNTIHVKQARLQLLTMGILAQVQVELEKLPEPNKSVALIEWEYADYFHRDHPLIAALAGIFGLTDIQVDQMFIEAAKL